MKDVTMADVADRAGVSKSTVSAVINDKDIVRDDTRERVWEAINELDYRPSGSARRGFSASSEKSIGFVIKETRNPYYSEVLTGIREVAAANGYLTFVCSSEGRFEEEKEIVKQFSNKDLSGLIITPILKDDTDLSHIFELKRKNIPFVLLEGVKGLRASIVDIDNVQASSEAAKHLIELGHEHIVHFAGPAYSDHSQKRVEGVRRAFSESHLAYTPDMKVEVGDSFEAGYERGLEYFGSLPEDERPTGVTCYNDLTALGLMKALRELGIAVPDEVSVVGFDDLDILEYFPVALTTVQVPKYEMGHRATEILLQRIESGRSQMSEQVSLEAELVNRHSTAPPSG